MPGAVIVIDQSAGAGAGSPGVARNDLWQGREVSLSIGTGGNTSPHWTLLDIPPGSAAALSSATEITCTFTPDLVGTYRIQLVVNGGGPGNIQTLVARVRRDADGFLSQRGWAYPAKGEIEGESNYGGNTRGWSEALESILEDVRLNGMSGGGGGGGAGSSYLTFIPSGIISGAGVYDNWTTLMAAAAGIRGLVKIVIYEDAVIPPGTWELDGRMELVGVNNVPTVDLVDGCIFNDATVLRNLSILSYSTSTVFRRSVLSQLNMTLYNVNMQAQDAGHLFVNASFQTLHLREGSSIYTGAAAGALISLTGGQALSLELDDRSSVDNDCIIGAFGSTVLLTKLSRFVSFGTQSAFSGFISTASPASLLTNSDIDAAAAISGTKINADFGNSVVSTTNVVIAGGFWGVTLDSPTGVPDILLIGHLTCTSIQLGHVGINTLVPGSLQLSALGTGLAHFGATGLLSSSLLIDADVDAAAAIAGTKVSPNFGSQTVRTTGPVTSDGKVTGTEFAFPTGTVPSFSGTAELDLTGLSTYTLLNTEYNKQVIACGGTLSADCDIILPPDGIWLVANFTGGGYRIRPKTVAGYGVYVEPGRVMFVFSVGGGGGGGVGILDIQSDTPIVNAKIASGAAIDGSKINPDFGSQAVSTTSSYTGYNFALTAGSKPDFGGTVNVSMAGLPSYTLTNVQYNKPRIDLTGAPGGPTEVIFPTTGMWLVCHQMSGGSYALLKTAAGTGINLLYGKTALVYGDGTNISEMAFQISGIVNSEIDAAAAIAGSKIVSDFGNQQVLGGSHQITAGNAHDFFGTASPAIAGLSTYTLLSSEYNKTTLYLSGALTSALDLILPNFGIWIIYNVTTGAYPITAKTAAGTGVIAPRGKATLAAGNGTNIFRLPLYDTLDRVAVSVAGTGSTTLATGQIEARVIDLTGILTGDRTITLPVTDGFKWTVINNTTGNFVLYVNGGTNTFPLARRQAKDFWTNGTKLLCTDPYSYVYRETFPLIGSAGTINTQIAALPANLLIRSINIFVPSALTGGSGGVNLAAGTTSGAVDLLVLTATVVAGNLLFGEASADLGTLMSTNGSYLSSAGLALWLKEVIAGSDVTVGSCDVEVVGVLKGYV